MLTRSLIVALCAPVLFGFVLPSSADVTRDPLFGQAGADTV